MTKDQTTGILERIVYAVAMAVLTKLVAKGYIDQDMAAYLAAGVVTFVGGAWAWWINRPKALAIAAANTGATVITSEAIAQSTPNHPNILSNTEVEAVQK